MFESFANKLLDGVAQARQDELARIKSKVRSHPDEVEAWFDKEIEKITKIDVGELVRKARAMV